MMEETGRKAISDQDGIKDICVRLFLIYSEDEE